MDNTDKEMTQLTKLLKYEATQANSLVRAKYSYTMRELKLSRLIISEINPYEEAKDFIEISREKIFQYLAPNSSKYGSIYDDIADIIKSLNNKPIEIYAKKKKTVIYWIASHSVDYETGKFQFEISKKMKPLLFALKGNFSSIPLHIYNKFRSPYPSRMYEILYSYRHMRGNMVTYDDWETLQDQLGGSHAEYSNFKSRILNKTQQNLKKHTDLRFEYRELKKKGSRKVKGLELKVFYNKPLKEAATEEKQDSKLTLFSIIDTPYDTDQELIAAIEKTLLGWGISQAITQRCIEDPFSFIENELIRTKVINQFRDNKLDYVWDKMEYTVQSEAVKDEAPYFLAALKNNYQSKKRKLQKKQLQKSREKEQREQLKIKLEKEKADLTQKYYDLFYSLMESVFKEDKAYFDFAIKEVKKLPISGYKIDKSLEDNLKGRVFRSNLLSFVKADQVDIFKTVETEYKNKIDAINQSLNQI